MTLKKPLSHSDLSSAVKKSLEKDTKLSKQLKLIMVCCMLALDHF
jgi:hypothetical protein